MDRLQVGNEKGCEEMIPIFSQFFLHKIVYFQRAKPGLHVLPCGDPAEGFQAG